MHLITPLASGIVGAPGGGVTLLKRGSATQTLYYLDFEATQTYVAQPILLDANGSAVVYVTELVDVQVRDASGVLIREFVAGDNANAVEVISQSFTGTNYTSGQVAVGQPTTLQSTFDVWRTSAGAPDYKVLVNGSAVTLQVAVAGLAGLFFNVKSYGAIGNAGADDTAAITAAITAATVAGGIVFFPPGVYRVTASITLPVGVSLLGCGGASSKLAMDTAGGPTQLLLFSGGGIASTTVQGLSFGALQAFPGSLVTQTGFGRLTFVDCQFGADNNVTGKLFTVLAMGVASLTVFQRCYFESRAGVVRQVDASNGARVAFHDCEFVNAQATGITHCDIQFATFESCRFDSTSVAAGGTIYITAAPSPTLGSPLVRGCFFGENAAIKPQCLVNTLATPTVDFHEVDNTFGSTLGFTNITPYTYVTDGYANPAGATVGAHLSRLASTECYGALTAATVTTNPKANGHTIVQKTTGATLQIGATKGMLGDTWILDVSNTTGANVTVSSTGVWTFVDGAATFVVATGASRRILFVFTALATGSTGFWQQVALSATA